MQAAVSDPRKVFWTIWTTQFVSALGTGLTSFSLGVYVYRRTGSTSEFALVMVCSMVPVILLSPFSGAMGDRWDRRRMMLAANCAAGLVILAMEAVNHWGGLALWAVYPAAAMLAICGAFRDPAYYASVSQLVSKDQLGRASGLVQTGENVGIVAPPLVAGLLLGAVGISGILVVDLASYGLGALALALTMFPELEHKDGPRTSLLKDMSDGWKYVLLHRGVLHLFLFGAFISFTVGVTQIVVTPLVLGFASTSVLGATFSGGGFGIVLGGVVMAAWGGPKRRILGVLVFGTIQALSLVVAGLRGNAVVIGLGLFVCLFCIQFVRGCSSTILRTYVPDAMQARVFALNRMVSWSTLPVAYLLAGPLVDVFEPLLKPGGSLAGSVGTVLGTGGSRGIGLLLVVLGGAFLLVVLAASMTPRLLHVETDMAAETAAEQPSEPAGAEPSGAPDAPVGGMREVEQT